MALDADGNEIVEAAPQDTEPVVEEPAKGPAPWDAWVAEDFEEAEREKVDAFLRKRYQPYVTKINDEKADLAGKAWVFDKLEEDPVEALREIAGQVWEPALADRIVELVQAGETVEDAEEQAEEEKSAGALPPDVQELVDWAKARKASEAADATAAEEAQALEEAGRLLSDWSDKLLTDEPDIIKGDLMAYVAGPGEGDFERSYALYRAAHPKPEPVKEGPPPTARGGSSGSIQPARRMSSLAEAAGSVFDAARGAS